MSIIGTANIKVDIHPIKNKILVSTVEINNIDKNAIVLKESFLLKAALLSENEFDHLQSRLTQALKRPLNDLPLALGALKTFHNKKFHGVQQCSIDTRMKIENLFSPYYQILDKSSQDSNLKNRWNELLLLTKLYGEMISIDFDNCFKKLNESKLNDLSSIERAAYIISIIDNNAFSGDGCMLLFETASRMSHACIPNCSWSIKNDIITVKPLAKIQKLEEITISYFSLTALENEYNFSTIERRKYLFSSKYFICECLMCSREDKTRCFKCKQCNSGNIYLNDRLPNQKKKKDKKKMDNKCNSCKDTQQATLFKNEELVWIGKVNKLKKLFGNNLIEDINYENLTDQDFKIDNLNKFLDEILEKTNEHWVLYFVHTLRYYAFIHRSEFKNAIDAANYIIQFLENCYSPLKYQEQLAYWYRNLGSALQYFNSLRESIKAYETSMSILEQLNLSE